MSPRAGVVLTACWLCLATALLAAVPAGAEVLSGVVTRVWPQRVEILVQGPCRQGPGPRIFSSGECPRSPAVCLPRVGDEFGIYLLVNGQYYREVARGRVTDLAGDRAGGSWRGIRGRQPRPGMTVSFYCQDPRKAGTLEDLPGPPGCGQPGDWRDWRYKRSQTRPPWSPAERYYSRAHRLEYPLGDRRGDPRAAAPLYAKAAELGHAQAAFQLYYLYKEGRGVKKDQARAVRWLTRAAELGHPGAQAFLGDIYANGEMGVKRNLAQAIHWYRKAAAQGNRWGREELKKLGIGK